MIRRRSPAWNRESSQLLLRWLVVAIMSWSVGNLLITQIRAPFALQSLQGWQDAFAQLAWTAPFELAPLGVAAAGWIALARDSLRITSSRMSHALSLAALLPVLLAAELALVAAILVLGPKSTLAPADTLRLALAASLEHGQYLDWLLTHGLMIVVPRVALDGKLCRAGFANFEMSQ